MQRVGTVHQAGSDSLLTSDVFFAIKNELGSKDNLVKYKNKLYGLGGGLEMAFVTESPDLPMSSGTYYDPAQIASMEHELYSSSPSIPNPYYPTGLVNYYSRPTGYSASLFYTGATGYEQGSTMPQQMYPHSNGYIPDPNGNYSDHC